MSLLSSIEQGLGFNLSSDSTVNASTDSKTSTPETAASTLFASLLSFGQEQTSTDSDSSDAESAASSLFSDTGIEGIQKQLYSALGFGDLSDETLSDMTSESSLSSMQSAFLTSLQANLFGGLTGSSSDSTATTTETSSTESSTDIFDSMATWTLGEDGFTLDDVFDSVNVLNHIPVVSDIYQASTGNTVDAGASLVGSFLFAGPLGVAYSVADMLVENYSGKSITDNVVDFGSTEWFSGNATTSAEIQARNKAASTSEE